MSAIGAVDDRGDLERMIHWPIGRYAALGVSIAALVTASAAPAQPIGNSRARVGPRLAEALRGLRFPPMRASRFASP